ncbi:MAG: signal transduction histidine kinase [Marivirga sp.]
MLRLLFSTLLFLLVITSNWAQDFSFDSLNTFYGRAHGLYQNSSVDRQDFKEQAQAIKEELLFEESISSEKTTVLLTFVAKSKALGEYELANSLLNNGIAISRSTPVIKGFFYYVKGDIIHAERKALEALENYLKASIIFDQIKDKAGLAYTNYKIAMINFDGQNNSIALKYAEQSIVNFSKQKQYSRLDSVHLATLYNLKGVANRRMKQYDSALLNINKSISLSRSMGDSLRVAIANGNKAVVFYEQGDFALAAPLLQEDYGTSMSNGVYVSAFNAGVILSNIYLKLEQPQALDSMFQQLISLKEKEDIYLFQSSLLAFYELAVDFYRNKNEDSLASLYLTQSVETKKHIDSVKRANDFDHFQEKYLMEKELTKVELLQKTNELQSTHLKLRTTLLVIIALALIAVLLYVYVLRNKNQKIDKLNELLEVKVSDRTTRLLEINKELDNYLYRASHDIRRPIRTLLGLSNVVKFTNDPEELKSLFDRVYDTAISMDEMLFKLQMAYELNNTHEMEEVNVYELVNQSIAGMERTILAKNAAVGIEKNAGAESLKASNVLLKIAIDNILENALIYHNLENPEVHITTDVGRYYFYIHIRDNGYGIDEAYYRKIFDAYFKISNKTQGSGLGLFLAHKAISFLAGEIVVESIINEGSQFTIKIPINPK